MLHVPIYVTVNGMVPRHVDCEHCGQEYVYELVRTGVGEEPIVHLDTQEEVHRRASDAALVSLTKALQTGTDAVPCPACGAYQPEMFEGLRRAKFRWVRGTAIVLFCLAVLVGGLWGIGTGNRRPRPEEEAMQLWFGIGAVAFLAGSFALMLVYFAKKRGYDPNTTPVETRLAAARLRAATADEVRDGYSGIAAPKPWNKRGR